MYIRAMRRILCLFALCASVAFGALDSKIAYLSVEYPSSDRALYVGQNVDVKYTLTLLEGATKLSEELLDFSVKNNNLELVSKSAWSADSKGALHSTYTFNIKAKHITFPALSIAIAAKNSSEQLEPLTTQGAKAEAIELSSNPRYINVIANNMEVVDYKVSEYDDKNNILIFQIECVGNSLSQMKIAAFDKQGLEQSKVLDGITYGIYYVVLNKSLRQLSFDYFNITQNQFVNITLPINIISNTALENSDIKPRNTFLMFKNLLLGVLIIFGALVYFVFKKIRKITLGVLIVLVLIMLYNIFFSATSGIAKPGASISILPTHNSTITLTIKEPSKIAIIGEYEEYYKVIVDSKVGWIRKEYVSKD